MGENPHRLVGKPAAIVWIVPLFVAAWPVAMQTISKTRIMGISSSFRSRSLSGRQSRPVEGLLHS